MGSFIEKCVDRYRVVLLLLAIITICGLFSYSHIPKESDPDVKIPIIYTMVTLDGISAQDAERLLAKPLETSLKGIDGVKEMTTYTSEGGAFIMLEFEAGFNNEKALNDVRNKTIDAEAFLPTDARKPTVHEINLSLSPVLYVILTGDIPERSLQEIAKNLSNKISNVPGILKAHISGRKIDSLEIIIKPELLNAYKLSISSIQQIISGNNKLITAGSIRNASGEFSIKIPSLIKDYQNILDFPIKVNANAVVKLRDIAEVRRTYKEPKDIASVNGKPAVAIEVSKRTGENIIKTVNAIKSVVEKEKKFIPQNVDIIYSADQSHEIMEMVSDLENTIIIAVLLVVIIIVVSVGMRSALLISISIPTSFLAGILMLYLSGYTLNVVVLFSLILTVGMIVDDAIVVSEYADRIMGEGIPVEKAFVIAAQRMMWPIVTSTLVKIVVFLPLLFWPGVIGQFMRYMPITAIAILSSSLVFALFFQPALGPFFGKANQARKNNHKNLDISDLDKIDLLTLDKVTQTYYNLLQKVLKHPKAFAGSTIGLLVLIYAFFFSFGTGLEFFPKVEPQSTNMFVVSPGNLSLQERKQIMIEVEKRLLDMDTEIKLLYTKAGNFDDNNSLPEDTIGTIFIEYVDWDKRRKSKFILEDIRSKLSDLKGVKIHLSENQGGGPQEYPINFDITSRDFSKATIAANKIFEHMQKDHGFDQVQNSIPKNAIEWHLDPNREKAALYGISISDIGNTIKLISNGLKLTSYRPDDALDEVDIMLRFPEEYRTIQNLDRVNIITSSGHSVPISNFITKTAAPKSGKIKKVNQEQVITIKSQVSKGYLVDTKLKQLKTWIQENNIDKDVQIKFKGEDRDQNETGSFLIKAFLLTLVMMFGIMLIQFNSYYQTFVVMSAVFLSTVGVLLGLIITWQPFGVVMCGIGIIALGGIVLNNNILFIDTYQHLRNNGNDVYESIIGAGVQRMRPILLTALTAILGLLPMVFGITFNIIDRDISFGAPSSEWWRQLSASIAGGLSFATLLTLFFTPCLLLIGKRFDSCINKK
jgi:multidrug efflux pump